MNVTPEGFTAADSEKITQHYLDFGFSVIRNVLDRDLIEDADRHVQWLTAKYPNLRPEHLHHPLIRKDAFWVRFISDPRLLDIVQLLLGQNLACFTAHYICKPPTDGHAVLWHQDGAYWKLEPMQAVAAWIAVDATFPENGCLRMIPGSHRAELSYPELSADPPNMLHSRTPPRVVDDWLTRNGVVDVMLQPGDISIHHPCILHSSGPNNSQSRRCGLDVGYVSTSTRVANADLYLNPLLVRGAADPGINTYRPWPTYDPEQTITFRDESRYSREAADRNSVLTTDEAPLEDESSIDATQRMIARLRQGTVKR